MAERWVWVYSGPPLKPIIRSNFNSRCFDRRYVFKHCFTLPETVFFVVDHLWTHDSLSRALTFGGKTGPCID